MKRKRRCVIILLLIIILIGTSSSLAAGKEMLKFLPGEKRAYVYRLSRDCKLPGIAGLPGGVIYLPAEPRTVTIPVLINGGAIAAVAKAGLLVISMIAGGILYFTIKKRTARVISSLRKEVADKSLDLEIASEENDWLVKEIHHRVKNNFQVIMSLLNTQLSYLRSEEAIRAIRNSQHRLYAIALVHQKLYQTDSLSSVDMGNYTYELLEYLKDAYDNVSRQIEFTVDMVPLSLDMTMAVPFGLILNEAISNVFKYAFPNGTGGKVNISLQACNTNTYNFSIADNGVGIIGFDNWNAADSFGRSLIAGLAKQMGGIYEMRDDNGVQIFIKFSRNGEHERFTARIE